MQRQYPGNDVMECAEGPPAYDVAVNMPSPTDSLMKIILDNPVFLENQVSQACSDIAEAVDSTPNLDDSVNSLQQNDYCPQKSKDLPSYEEAVQMMAFDKTQL